MGLSGILSQDFKGPVGNDRAIFLFGTGLIESGATIRCGFPE